MEGNSSSGNKSHKTISSSSASSRPSLLDSTMPPIDNDMVECVGVGVGSTTTIGPQNPSSALPPKSRKVETTSSVWEHFTKLEGDPKDPKSKCNYCGGLFSCHRSHGTSSILQHIRKSCKKFPSRFDKSQSKLSFEAKREGQVGVGGGEGSCGNLVIAKYSAQKIRLAISKMIIVDELPFKFVEGDGFQEFMKTVEPRFLIPSRYTIMRDCVKLFMSEKEKLRAMFLTTGARVCLTTDCWTSVQNLNYMCVTAHWVDSEWNLHKRILNFCLIPNHKGETNGQKIETCMIQWGINNIFTVTVDNASSNDTSLDYLKKRTAHKVGAILENQFMHVRCCAHILNLIVSEGLKEVDDSIVKVRSAVKYVKSSPSRFENFKTCIEREKITFKGLLCLDVPTRWNSTFKMLEGAEKCQSAFELMEEHDGNYVSSMFDEKSGKKGLGPPNYDDWARIRIFLKFLKLFYEVTMRLSGSLYVTCNMYFQEICGIQMHLQAYSESGDYILSSMAEKMLMKYNKYWGDLDRVNVLMFIAVILDPRTKLGSLEYWFKDVLSEEQCTKMVKKLKHNLQQLYDHFNVGESSSQVEHGASPQNSSFNVEETENISLHFMNKFHKYLTSKSDVHCKSEIDRYLMEDVEKPNASFDILNWWKVNSTKFPVLAQIARIVLAIPITTVASESAFSTGGLVLDPFRSSLAPNTVEALICAQNWLSSKPLSSDTEIVEDVESYKLNSEMILKNINILLEED